MAILTPTRSVGQGGLQIAHLRYFTAAGAAVTAGAASAAADWDFNTIFAAYTKMALNGIVAEIDTGLSSFTVNQRGIYRVVTNLRGLYDTDADIVSNTVTVNGAAVSPAVRTDATVEAANSDLNLHLDTLLYLNRGDIVRPRWFSSGANVFTVKQMEFLLYGL